MTARQRSSLRQVARAPSQWPPTWPVVAPTSCSAAIPRRWQQQRSPSRVCHLWRIPRATRPLGPQHWRRPRLQWQRSTRRSSVSAGFTFWQPSVTSHVESIISCAVDPAVRVTRVRLSSTSHSKTTSCACSRPTWLMPSCAASTFPMMCRSRRRWCPTPSAQLSRRSSLRTSRSARTS